LLELKGSALYNEKNTCINSFHKTAYLNRNLTSNLCDPNMQTSISQDRVNGKSSKTDSFFKTFSGVGVFGFLLALPTEIHAWFDGLPWTGGVETVALSVVIPFLLILRWRFLSQRSSILFIFALLFLKAILFFGSPSSGLLVKVYPNLSQESKTAIDPFKKVKDEGWVRTYATLWNKNASGILLAPWNKKMEFPLDWVLFTSVCVRKAHVCYDAVNAIIEIEGALLIPKGKKFSFLAKGVEGGTLLATNERGVSFILEPIQSIEDVIQQKYNIPTDGRWEISGKLSYSGPDWSFVPVLVENNGKVATDLGREVLWQNYADLLSSSSLIGFYKLLSIVVDGGIVVFLLLWIVAIIKSMIKKQILNIPFSIFCVSAVCLPYIMAPFFAKILKIVRLSDPVNTAYLGVSFLVVGASFLFWAKWKKDLRNFQAATITLSTLMLFAPALLFYFSKKWWHLIGQGFNWGSGDDWIAYQSYGRRVVVEGDWLRASEGVFTMQPLYRYIVGIYHWLFGQTAFAQNMADVWCFLGAAILIACFAGKFRVSPAVILIACITYLSINLMGSFRYLIGRGLTENHAMFFLVIGAWFIYRAREGSTKLVVLAALLGIFGYWIRLDHLGAVAGLAFLLLEPVDGPTGGWKGYWDRFQLQRKRLSLYWGLGIFSVLLISFRNWWLGGDFFVSNTSHGNFIRDLDRGNYYLILTGNSWGHFPSIAGFIMTIGVLLALLALIWRPKPLLNFPLSLGIIFVGLLAPYSVLWTGGYPPRWSVHVLPLSVLVVAILMDKLRWFQYLLPSGQSRL
jgi:hypothetical protein